MPVFGPSTSSSALTGNFLLRTLNGQALPATADSSGTTKMSVIADTLTFNSDKTIREVIVYSTVTPPGAPVISKSVLTGTYSLSGTALAITYVKSGSLDTFDCTFINGRVTLTDAVGVWVFSK